jgi:hypothetical protein
MKEIDPIKLERLRRTANSTAVGRGKMGWYIDYDALGEFCDYLELTYPVRIRFSSSYKTLLGTHRFNDNEHKITISQVWPAERANNTILHELAHAVQEELYRINNPGKRFYPEYKRRQDYYEKDADNFADKYEKEGIKIVKV